MYSFITIYLVAVTNPPSMAGFNLDREGASTIQSALAPFQLLVGMFGILFTER